MNLITILLVTYNSDWIKTRQTLFSIITQKNIDFELIIADDGSKNNNFTKIEEYLNHNSFTKYVLIGNEVNKGTVQNILSAIPNIKGEYLKLISPGDFLYDDTTLYNFYKLIERSSAKVFFGNACYYSENNKNITLYKNNMPLNIKPFLDNNLKAIKRNYFITHDYILGCTFIVQSELFFYYLEKYLDNIIFAEDTVFIAMLSDNISFSFYNEPFIWYEYGSGISTNRNTKWSDILNKEVLLVLHTLKDKGYYEKKGYLIFKNNLIPNKLLRLIKNTKAYCPYIFIKILHKIESKIYKRSKHDILKLQEIIN